MVRSLIDEVYRETGTFANSRIYRKQVKYVTYFMADPKIYTDPPGNSAGPDSYWQCFLSVLSCQIQGISSQGRRWLREQTAGEGIVSWLFHGISLTAESERSADGDILSSVWNSRRQVVEKTAGEEGCNKAIREKSGEIRRRKGICIRHRRKQGRRA